MPRLARALVLTPALCAACSTSPDSSSLPPDASAPSSDGGAPVFESGAGDVASNGSSDVASSPPASEGGACGQSLDAAIVTVPNLAAGYTGTFSSPPTQTSTSETPDGPLLGNGDLGVVVLGTIDAMKFVLGKNEFWSLATSGTGAVTTVKAMASLSLAIPGMTGASYAMTENVGTGIVSGTFALNGNSIATTSWVQATDTTKNLLFTQFSYTGATPQNVTVSLAAGDKNLNPATVGSSGNVLTLDVAADNMSAVNGSPTRQVRVATGIVGTTGTVANNALSFTLSSGENVTLASSIMSNVDSASYETDSVSNVSTLTPSAIAADNTAHVAWWDTFHRASFVELADKTIEKEYYASLYLLASTSRAGEAPPGLWGNWILTDPAWNSDYTLNYNYEAPFYGTFPTNHLDVSANYDAPVIAWVPKAQAEATANGWTGAYYRVHIGPLPNGSADTSEHNQKSCGAFAATDMIMHYYYDPDPAYAASIYPTLKQIATFWQNYLVQNGTTYDIVNDAQQEDDPSPQTNGVMSLGLVRYLLQACIDISAALGSDVAERAVWQGLLANLAPFPTYTGCPTCSNGETVFRYTSVGRDWATGNAIGIQHIYPGSQIGLSSDPALLSIANNTVGAMARWSDGNGTVTFYPAAARVGYKPETILSQLDSWIGNNTYPNLHIHTGGGGVENLNTVPATVAEMLLQSFQGVIRVFADWPKAADARFGNLRAYGGFLVASGTLNGAVQYVAVTSERGGAFTLANPWSASAQASLAVYRNGTTAPAISGAMITEQTCAGDVFVFAPAGTSYATVLAEMNGK